MSRELIASLAKEIERLWRSPRPSSSALRQIARGLILVTADADSAAEAFGAESDSLQLDSTNAVLSQSLLAGRVVAWFSAHFVALHTQAEDLVLAALLADSGCCRPLNKKRIRACRPDDVDHVHIAAAFVAGFDDVPASLPQRIARHHERSDGTGFPRGMTSANLNAGDRAIAAAVRFAELFAGSPLAAAKRLHHEARLGAFDAELTANLLWSMGGEFPADGGFKETVPRQWILTDHGRRRLRIDPPHAAVNTPHFLNTSSRTVQRTSSGNGYRT
jgi:hypothetical protein